MVSQLAQYHMLTNLSFFPLMQNVIFIMLPSLHVQRNNCPVYGLLLQDIYLAALSCKQVWHLNHRAGWKTYDTGGVRGGRVWAGVGGLEWMMEVPRGFSLKSDKKRKAPRSNRENPQEEKHIGKRRKMTRRNAVYRFFCSSLPTLSLAEANAQYDWASEQVTDVWTLLRGCQAV